MLWSLILMENCQKNLNNKENESNHLKKSYIEVRKFPFLNIFPNTLKKQSFLPLLLLLIFFFLDDRLSEITCILTSTECKVFLIKGVNPINRAFLSFSFFKQCMAPSNSQPKTVNHNAVIESKRFAEMT